MIKNWNDFLNERYDSKTLPNNVVLLSIIKDNYTTLLLYNDSTKKPIAYITFSLYENIGSFTVNGVYSSEKGYGVFLYECAMTFVYPNTLSMSRDSTTSDDALNVWFKFKQRKDVKNDRIFSDEVTHKKRDWIESGFLDDNIEYRDSIFELEDTRFSYNFGKEKLNKLIKVGRTYMQDNDISEKEVEYMCWDLEI